MCSSRHTVDCFHFDSRQTSAFFQSVLFSYHVLSHIISVKENERSYVFVYGHYISGMPNYK